MRLRDVDDKDKVKRDGFLENFRIKYINSPRDMYQICQ